MHTNTHAHLLKNIHAHLHTFTHAHLHIHARTPAHLQPVHMHFSFRDEEAKMELEGGDEFIEVKVTSPHKVGMGQ